MRCSSSGETAGNGRRRRGSKERLIKEAVALASAFADTCLNHEP